MTRSAPATHRKSRQSRHWPILALVLLLTAAGCITIGLRGHQVALPGPVALQNAPLSTPGDAYPPASSGVGDPATGSSATPQTLLPDPPGDTNSAAAPGPGPALAAGVTAPAAPRSAPVALQIPAIGVQVSLTTLGLNPDRTVEVPTDFRQAGWFGLGPTPGQVGSAVILGHVDSYKGPAVFFRIRALQAGDQVNVTLVDGATAHFAVTAVAMYAKDQFPAQQVYASHGDSALQLVTCGGSFDTQSRSYRSNIVAYTTLVGTTPANQSQR